MIHINPIVDKTLVFGGKTEWTGEGKHRKGEGEKEGRGNDMMGEEKDERDGQQYTLAICFYQERICSLYTLIYSQKACQPTHKVLTRSCVYIYTC